jgi:hypothetical protein
MAIEVRPMYGFVAYRACLILSRLVVKIRRASSAAETGSRVTLQAENVLVAGFEQTRIRRAVRGMARFAALSLDRLMLEDEGPLFVCMARVADRILRCRRAQLSRPKTPVGVVAIGALNKSLFHAVVKRHVELWLNLLMTAVTEILLIFDQQKIALG